MTTSFMNTPFSAPVNAPNQPVQNPNQMIESSKRVYTCRDCQMQITGAGTLALHVLLRHGRQSYKTHVEKTFVTIQNSIAATTPISFNNPCPVPGCNHMVGNTQQLVDFHLMYSHACDADPTPYISAYTRQREVWESTYRNVRGWTQQDANRNQVPMNNPY